MSNIFLGNEITEKLHQRPELTGYMILAIGDTNFTELCNYEFVQDGSSNRFRMECFEDTLRPFFNDNNYKAITNFLNNAKLVLDIGFVEKNDNDIVAVKGLQRIPTRAAQKIDNPTIDTYEAAKPDVWVTCEICPRYFLSKYHEENHYCQKYICDHCVINIDRLFFNEWDFYSHLVFGRICTELCDEILDKTNYAGYVKHIIKHMDVTSSRSPSNCNILIQYCKFYDTKPEELLSYYIEVIEISDNS